jgi:hypothetical protein
MKLFSLCFAGAVLAFATGNWQLSGQTTADVSAIVQLSNGQRVTVTDFSDAIGLAASEIVDVTVQFPAANAGENVDIGQLDGGCVSNGSSVVTNEGVVAFRFQATPNAGQNRVILRHGSQTLRLQFWVLNPANPQNNPPVVTPENQEG